MSALRNLTR